MKEELEVILALLGIISFLAIIAAWVRFSFPVLLVIAGLLIGVFPGLPKVHVEPDFVFLLILPPLLYSSAFLFPWKDFRANVRSIFLLAIGLVIATTVAVGFASAWFIPGMTLAAGFVLGAIVSPPDAVAASAVLKKLSIPKRVLSVLEGESLVNDASGLVLFQFAVAALVTGAFSPHAAALDFLWVATGGPAIGLLLAWGIGKILTRVQEPVVEMTFSIMIPFLVYLVAEEAQTSGVLAVVAAGMFLGHHSDEIFSNKARVDLEPVWGFIRHLLESLVFILIGLEFPSLLKGLRPIPEEHLFLSLFLLVGLVVAVRFAWIFAVSWLLKRVFVPKALQEPPILNRHLVIMSWCGMRGVVSMAAAMSIPRTTADGEPTPDRYLILFLTFGVIFTTLLLPTLTLPTLVKKLRAGVNNDRSRRQTIRLRLSESALEQIPTLASRCGIDTQRPVVMALMEHFRQRKLLHASHSAMKEDILENNSQALHNFVAAIFQELRRELRAIQERDEIDEEDRRVIRNELDIEEMRLQRFFH